MEQLERDQPTLGIELTSDAEGDPLIKLSGELDMSNADSFREAIDTVLAVGTCRLVLELGGLNFMDSSGIAILIFASNSVERVELKNTQPTVRRVLEVTGLTDIFQIDPS